MIHYHKRGEYLSRKTLLIGALVAPTALLADEAGAFGMKSRVAHRLRLTPGGRVEAHGPLVWEADQVSAVVAVVVTQGNSVAIGASARYQNGHAHWHAETAPGIFHTGPATAYGTMVSRLSDGSSEFYSWTVAVKLHH